MGEKNHILVFDIYQYTTSMKSSSGKPPSPEGVNRQKDGRS